MADSIFTRMQRVVSAGVGTAIDAVEQFSSSSLMREAIREIDRAGDKLRAQQEVARGKRRHADDRRLDHAKRLNELAEQAAFAVAQRREDLARVAVGLQVDLERETADLAVSAAAAASEDERLEEKLADLMRRRSQMAEELAACLCAQEANADGIERLATRAEELFARAANASQPVGSAVALDSRVGQIDQLQREIEIAARMRTLREGATESPTMGKRERKRGAGN